MTFHCEKSLYLVETTLIESDKIYLKEIKDNDKIINELEDEIKSLAYSLLIRQQPVASHFRYISSVLKIITDLERIGDYSKEISLILNEYDLDTLKYKQEIIELSKDVNGMLIKSMNSFLNQDNSQSTFVIDYDKYVDKGLHLLKEKLVDDMVTQKDLNNQKLDIYMIGKYYERCGDRCVNIANHLQI